MIIRKLHLVLLTSMALCISSGLSHAWDAMGHRLSAEIALRYLSDNSKQKLRQILQTHPRYQQDFLSAMPAYIEQANEDRQLAWLLGQAAYWPDIARGLRESQRQRYNRPNWHYIDGTWVRDAAQLQGNVYLGRSPSPLIQGRVATSIGQEDQVANIMMALDFNSRRLSDSDISPTDKALALCWFLHLAADIHQPLHAGSLFSSNLFANGDRGGNAIPTDQGNLHYRWDSALSDRRIGDNLQQIDNEMNPALQALAQETFTDWSIWLDESRNILVRQVYSNSIRQQILNHDRRNSSLPHIRLNSDYIQAMEDQSRGRLALAGLRIAYWLNAELP